MTMSLRVAVVTESFLPSLNGVTNSVLRVLDTFRQQGHEAMIIAPTAPAPRHLGFEVVRAPAIQLKKFQWGMPTPFLQANLERFEPDVVHVASPVFLGGQAIAVAERMGVPSVAIYQTDIAGYVERYGLKFARPVVDKIMATIHMPATYNLAPTLESANYLRAMNVPNVEVWGRGVDLDLFNPNENLQAKAYRNTFAADKEVVIGYVGRLAEEKQVHRMAELFGIKNARFLIVGDGPERANLEAKFAGKPVTFAGKLTGLELAAAYASMDIFVHFGTEETFGQTIQEAQATGLSVIAPNSGGPKFLIENGQDGFLIDAADVNGFRREAESLVANQGLRARLGESARRRVLAKSWEANNARLINFYHAAIARTKTATDLSMGLPERQVIELV